MNRAEHLAWAKERALEYARKGDGANALASLVSDFAKHPELETSIDTARTLGGMMLMGGFLSRVSDIVEFVEGFN